MIHEHAQPDVVEAVSAQLRKGTAYMVGTEAEVLFAEHLCSRNAGFEQIRFVNSGTEAIMNCIKAARAYTGRAKLAKVEGAYHGGYDYAEVSQMARPESCGHVNEPASIATVAGRRDIMQLMNPRAEPYLFPLSGTFSANPVTMTAGLISMQRYDEAAVQRLNALGERTRTGIREAMNLADVPFSLTGGGSFFRVHIKHEPRQTTARRIYRRRRKIP